MKGKICCKVCEEVLCTIEYKPDLDFFEVSPRAYTTAWDEEGALVVEGLGEIYLGSCDCISNCKDELDYITEERDNFKETLDKMKKEKGELTTLF